jgi:glycosyltransferase involved in cell wall biosynthesis
MITFVIFTYNEEKRIENVIHNYQRYGKVLLADGGSTDRTHSIAEANGCDIFIRPKTSHVFVENSEVMTALFEVVTTEWIFLGYSDELMSKETLEKVKAIINSNQYDSIEIHRKNYFYGEFCYDSYSSANNRFFKKWAYDFSDNFIHGMGKALISIDRIHKLPKKYFIHHFIDEKIGSHLSKLNRYTDCELDSPRRPQSKKTVVHLLYVIGKNLLKNYLFQGGYKTGFPAITLTEMTIFYELIRNMKVYEIENQLTDQAIENKNIAQKTKILKDFRQRTL